jgi:hypothetical protein
VALLMSRYPVRILIIPPTLSMFSGMVPPLVATV